MRRAGTSLLAAGSIALFVVLVFMWRSIKADTSRPAGVAVQPTATTPEAQATNPAAPAAPGQPGLPAARKPPASIGGTREAATPAPAIHDDSAPPATRGNTKNLHYGGYQLRNQTKAVEPQVRKCVERAVANGMRPTGDAVLTFIVAKRGDKYPVEDTSIDSDKTTIDNEPLLECLRETAREMTFEGLPREAEGLVVNRGIKIAAGEITEYKLIGFSYLR